MIIKKLEQLSQKRAIFQANNHSRYEISYRPILFEIGQNIVKLIENHFDHMNAIDAGTIEQVGEAEQASNNFKVRAGDEKYIVRKNILVKDEHDVSLTANILTFLKNKGVLVPEFIPTKTSAPFFYNDGAIWQMYRFVNGNHFRGSGDELKAAGAEIGRLHKALSELPLEYNKALQKKTPSLASLTNEAFQYILNEAEKKKESDIDSLFVTYGGYLRDLCEKVLNDFNKQRIGVRMQAIHGDLHPHNTIYPSEEKCFIIDFDMTQYGELLRDIAFATHRFVRQYVVWHKGDGAMASAGAALFLGAYQKENPLTVEEKKLIPLYMRHELLRRITTDFGRYYREGITRFATAEELCKKITLLQETHEIVYA
jgi:Ser/Thr protein kinase RdoA (MazF antagonist)